MKVKIRIFYMLVLLQIIVPGALLALTPAPDITDREVVEKLVKLEAGQQAVLSEMRAGQQALNQRITDLRSEMKSGQEALNKRLDDLGQRISGANYTLGQRISGANYTMVTLFGVVVALIATLFGYILWDRRTMMKPVVERVERIEKDVTQDLDLSNAEGSKLKRLIDAMRELAKTDDNMAAVLRSFSLL